MRTAYLTIDDAPMEEFLYKLDYLTEKRIPAVWFCEGRNIEKRFEFAVEAVRRGYVIGNHAWSHQHFSELPLIAAKEEITRTDDIINKVYKAAGKDRMKRYFRFPYGDKGRQETKSLFQRFLREKGYKAPEWSDVTYEYYDQYRNDVDWMWTFDTVDYALTTDARKKKFEIYTHGD